MMTTVLDPLQDDDLRVEADDRDGVVLHHRRARLTGDHDLLYPGRWPRILPWGNGGEILAEVGARRLGLGLDLTDGHRLRGLGRKLLLGLREDGGCQQEDRDGDALECERSDRRGSARSPCPYSHLSEPQQHGTPVDLLL
jgi:hypothetical protein